MGPATARPSGTRQRQGHHHHISLASYTRGRSRRARVLVLQYCDCLAVGGIAVLCPEEIHALPWVLVRDATAFIPHFPCFLPFRYQERADRPRHERPLCTVLNV